MNRPANMFDRVDSLEEVVEKLSEAGKEILAAGYPPRRILEEEEKAAYHQGYLDALAFAIYYINQI